MAQPVAVRSTARAIASMPRARAVSTTTPTPASSVVAAWSTSTTTSTPARTATSTSTTRTAGARSRVRIRRGTREARRASWTANAWRATPATSALPAAATAGARRTWVLVAATTGPLAATTDRPVVTTGRWAASVPAWVAVAWAAADSGGGDLATEIRRR